MCLFPLPPDNTGRIVTANCEPRKKERNANYNWEIYRDENFDRKLEILYTDVDDIGEYECGILDVSNTDNVNTAAKSQARNFMVFVEAMQAAALFKLSSRNCFCSRCWWSIQIQSNNVCLFRLQRVKVSFITAQPGFYHCTNVVYHCPNGPDTPIL